MFRRSGNPPTGFNMDITSGLMSSVGVEALEAGK